ncbi:MAG TPA: 7TM diverse intracellular signaling domain-containing protein [Chitinophagaceae bacterium]|nr:7TM diverse intracellular signaling domain-containing protein [Chitinophagaceae bacterium]
MNGSLVKFFVFALASIMVLDSFCQKRSPVITPINDPEIITSRVDVFKTERTLTLDSILKPEINNKFEHYTDKSIEFTGWDPYNYWFRFIIRNTDTCEKKYFVLLGHIAFQESLLYQKKDTGWAAVARSGVKYRFHEQTYHYIHQAMPFSIRASSTDTFYVSYDYVANFKTFVFALLSPAEMHKTATQTYFVFGLIIGVLALFFALNLYLYFALKEKLHLWYSGYLLMVIYLILKYEGFDKQFLGLDGYLAIRLTPVQAIASLACTIQIHLIQLFLSNISKKELLYKVTTFVKYNLLLSAIVHLVLFYFAVDYRIESVAFQWTNKSLNICLVSILINGIVSYRRNFKPALFVILGTIVFLIGGMEKLLFLENLSYIFPPSLFEIGLILEVGILSFAMMYRYNIFKKQKEALEAELTSQNNRAASNIVMAQEAERKRIAEDLHDEIGSSLAVLKIRMQNMNIESKDLEELISIVDKASSNTRNLSHNLMPPEFEKTSLRDLLQGYYFKLNNETSTRFVFIAKGEGKPFEKSTELMVYRIIIEITKNILMHAKATEATIQLLYEVDGLEIMAEDNGIGIRKSDSKGIGMKNIYSRVNYINGNITVDSGRKGTTIIINVPYTQQKSL